MNHRLHKAGSKIILWLLIVAMLVFTMTRTLHFLMLTLPADQQYTGYLALAAFDIGVLGWLYYATNAAEGTGQRVVAYGMIFVCAGGVLATTFADMLMASAKSGLTAKPDQNTAIIALWVVLIVIAMNFFAGILVHMVDPKHMKHMSTENAKDKIFAASLQAIDQRAQEIAPTIAAQVAAHWESQVLVEILGSLPAVKTLPAAQVKTLPAAQVKEVVTGSLTKSTPTVLAQTATPPAAPKKKVVKPVGKGPTTRSNESSVKDSQPANVRSNGRGKRGSRSAKKED